MKKLSKKQKLIVFIAILLVAVIIAIIITTSIIKNNNQVANEDYAATSANAGSSIISNYILNGIIIGGITGKMDVLNTSDATATAEEISWGKTAYVNGVKITGTRIDTVAQAKAAQKVFETDKTLIDDYGNSMRVPTGFKIADDSATAVEDGIVIEDSNGNQFVWIPAKTEAQGGATISLSTRETANVVYKRTEFGKLDGNYSNYSEAMPSDEESSVNAWGGYYIGRYEAGDKESTQAKTMRVSGSSQENTITIKKDQVPYNYITFTNLKSKAEGMDTVQGYTTATTKLVSSYAWDTAISFIQIKNSDYGTSSPDGNYVNTTFNYTDITEVEQTKNDNSSTLVPTGQTTAVCNIYDMGGNLWERTTESRANAYTSYVIRGGNYNTHYEDYPAGYRDDTNGRADIDIGFRITLYCKIES